MLLRRAAGALLALVPACAPIRPAPPPPDVATVILVSLDGFRWDYLDRPGAITLRALAQQGVHAEGLVPSFPSKTFPNHYTIVTGLYPGDHGVVANNMWDPRRDDRYSMANREAVRNGDWYGGVPIWVLVERTGRPTAPLFWPGSEAEIAGSRPTYAHAYDGDMTNAARVDSVLHWLDLPRGERPVFLTVYMSNTDDAGHRYGPQSPQTDTAIAAVDSAMARLVSGLRQRRLEDSVDIIVVSDHGMAPTAPDRVIFLDSLIDVEAARVVDWNPVAAIWPDSADLPTVLAQLRGANPHLHVYARAEIPARYHYRESPRIPPVLAVADEGWSITSTAYATDHPDAFHGGNHGYDPAARTMMGVLIARGPHFRHGTTIPPVQNIHLYDLMAHILGVTPAPNDGALDSVRAMLR